jgi:hypothetical protein
MAKKKINNKKYHTVGTDPKSNRKIAERGKINTPNTQMHDIIFLHNLSANNYHDENVLGPIRFKMTKN